MASAQIQATTLYPFVPSGTDFEGAILFFGELGFAVAWRVEGLVGLRFGGAYFMLQKIDVPEWQKNQVITYEATDLEGSPQRGLFTIASNCSKTVRVMGRNVEALIEIDIIVT